MLNPSKERVLEVIREKAQYYDDRIVNSEQLNPQVSPAQESLFVFGDSIVPTTAAQTQFLNRLQVPIIFYKRCSADLQQKILDEHNRRDRDFLIRCINQNDKVECRAVLSEHFSRDKDDIHVIPPTIEALKDNDTDISVFDWDDQHTHMVTKFNDCQINQGDTNLTGSVTLINSETGHSSVWIYPTIVINGYEYSNKKGDISNNLHRIIHRGTFKVEEFKQIIQDTKRIAQVGIVQYLRNQNEVTTVENAVNFVETLEDIPTRFSKILGNEWQNQQNIRKVDVMQQIMQLAQELPLFQKISVSRQVGRFIRLFENTQKEQTDIVNQIQGLN
jgi:hypothetical protein